MAGDEAYTCKPSLIDPSNSLAAIHQRHRQTGHTDSFTNGRSKMMKLTGRDVTLSVLPITNNIRTVAVLGDTNAAGIPVSHIATR